MGKNRRPGYMWKCKECGNNNHKFDKQCVICHADQVSKKKTIGRPLGTWQCKQCSKFNKKDDVKCRHCMSEKPEKKKSLLKVGRQKGFWMCKRCRKCNESRATSCRSCMAMREHTQYGIVQGEEIHLFSEKIDRDKRYIKLNEQGRLKKEDRKVLVTVQEG